MNFTKIFDEAWATEQFPPERTLAFFDALFGDPDEGAYTISLHFLEAQSDTLLFSFDLHQRDNRCLVCSLTYGLPQVFARHPIINVKGIVANVAQKLGKSLEEVTWSLGATQEHSSAYHSVPLLITLK